MSNSEVREFHGFDVNSDFILTLNAKKGKVKINLQECMAIRLAKSTDSSVLGWYDSTGLADSDVCKEMKISYNHIENCRSHESWNLAKESFASANELEDSQIALLKGKAPVGKSNGESKVKFTSTHAKNLGMAIFESLPKDLQTCLASFDSAVQEYQVECKEVKEPFVYGKQVIAYFAKTSYTANTTCNARVVDSAIKAFVKGAWDGVHAYNAEQESIKAELARQAREQRQAEAREKAEKIATVFGLEVPSADATESEKQEYDMKLNLLLELVD